MRLRGRTRIFPLFVNNEDSIPAEQNFPKIILRGLLRSSYSGRAKLKKGHHQNRKDVGRRAQKGARIKHTTNVPCDGYIQEFLGACAEADER